MNTKVLSLIVLAVLAISGFGLVVSSATTIIYPSKITIVSSWNGCNKQNYSEQIVITIPTPPTVVTYLSWRISPLTSDGIGGICFNQPFAGMSGQMLDLTQGWIEVLIPQITTASGSMQLNLSAHPLHLGDTISFGFQISYRITSVNVGSTCYNLGHGYSNCANLGQ